MAHRFRSFVLLAAWASTSMLTGCEILPVLPRRDPAPVIECGPLGAAGCRERTAWALGLIRDAQADIRVLKLTFTSESGSFQAELENGSSFTVDGH